MVNEWYNLNPIHKEELIAKTIPSLVDIIKTVKQTGLLKDMILVNTTKSYLSVLQDSTLIDVDKETKYSNIITKKNYSNVIEKYNLASDYLIDKKKEIEQLFNQKSY